MPRNDITSKILRKLYIKKLLTKKEIASLLKCNITTIHKKMKKFGVPARKSKEAIKMAMQKKIIEISKSKLENLYINKKLPIGEIAKKLHYCRETIERELNRHKIPLRTKAEALKLMGEKIKIKKSTLIKLYYQKKLTQKQIAKRVHRHPGTITRLMKEYNLKTRKASETLLRYPKNNFSGDLEEKSYLIGFRTGDLHATLSPSKRFIIVGTTSTKVEQIKLFKNLFRKYGHVWISKIRKDANRVVVVRLNRTFDFLLPKKDNIPKWVRTNKEYFLSFLAGYTDAEGCIYVSKNNVAGLKLSSYDKNVLKQINKKLLKIGIPCNPPRILVKKGHMKSDGCIYHNDCWCFEINKKQTLLSLLQFLKPRLKHQKRLKDLEKAEQNIAERNQKTFPTKDFFRYLPV